MLGLWASSGQQTITDEINALQAAVKQFGSSFTDLVDGISVGSEDLYRVTATSLMNDPSSVGASPDAVASYISQVRDAFKGSALSSAPVGHVDTWTAWVNSSNSAVVEASDFIGMDAYPYFQTAMANSIENGKSLFDSAFDQTKSFSKGKPVWVTETAWPLAGSTSAQAIPSTSNAQQYWEAVGCGELFGVTNTYWYTYWDDSASPSFGLVDTIGGQPRFDLSCSKKATISGSAEATATGKSAASKSVSVAASATGLGSPGVSHAAPSAGSASITGSGSGSGNGSATTFAASTATPTVGTGSGSSSPSSSSNPATGAGAVASISLASLVAAAVGAIFLL